MSAQSNYWCECVADAAEDAGAALTKEQIKWIADAVQGAYENYSLAFYSPPPSDRIADIEREWQSKLDQQKREHEAAAANADRALRKSLGIYRDLPLSINESGEVFVHNGRTTQVL